MLGDDWKETVDLVPIGDVVGQREAVDAGEVHPVPQEAAHREPGEREALDGDAGKAARGTLVFSLGIRASGVDRADPDPVGLSASIFKDDWMATRGQADELDTVGCDSERIEVTGRTFVVDARPHFDAVASVCVGQGVSNRLARVDDERAGDSGNWGQEANG